MGGASDSSKPATWRRTAWGGLAVGLLLLVGSSQAHFAGTSGDHGSLEVEVDRSTDPCMGTVRLSAMDFQNGSIEMNIILEGTAPDQTLDRRTFNGTAGEDGYNATLTGFEMKEGWDYYFVVEFDAEEFHGLRSENIIIDDGACGEPQEEPCFEVALTGTAHGDGSINITATGLDQEGELWRSSFGEGAEQLAVLTPEAPSYVDTDTEPGVAYTYTIIVEGDTCDRIEVTAIPFFPGAMAGLAGAAAMSVAYVALRRRR